jgi:tetratricopeptide (TPR) repeat protein
MCGGRQDGKGNMKVFHFDSVKMNPRSVATLVALAGLAVGLTGCDKLKARDLLHQGTAAYAQGQTDAAISDFQKAMALDPGLLTAQLYLATAYQQQYVPGATTPENVRVGDEAIAQYKDVLGKDAENTSAIDGLGSILFSMSNPFSADKLQESKTYWEKHIAVKPDDAEPYYWIGLIDWTLAYHENQSLRADYNRANPKKQIHDDQPLPPDLRQKLTTEESTTVAEAMDMLQKAIQRRSDYDDAVAYLSLMYRQKADMAASEQERDDFLKQEDALLEQVKQIKQKKASAQPNS